MRAADANVWRSGPNRSLLNRSHVYRMELTRTSPDPVSVWDIYFCGLVSMTMHPGFEKENTHRPTLEELAKVADAMLLERERKWL